MALVVPKERKHLSADALFRLVRSGFNTLPDHRSLDAEISLTDALMSAFAMFSLKSLSLLAFDKQRAEGNLQTILRHNMRALRYADARDTRSSLSCLASPTV